MAEHVLVPYDDSEQATRALDHVIDRHADAQVTLLAVIDIVEAGYATPVDGTLPGYWEGWYEEERDRRADLLDDARTRAADAGLDVDTDTVVGRPTRAINEYAEDEDVDHVVMGSHGRSGVSRVLLGSVAEGVVRRASVPVTVVR